MLGVVVGGGEEGGAARGLVVDVDEGELPQHRGRRSRWGVHSRPAAAQVAAAAAAAVTGSGDVVVAVAVAADPSSSSQHQS